MKARLIIREAHKSEIKTLAAIGVLAWESAFAASGEYVSNMRENANATYWHFCEQYWHIIKLAEIDHEIIAWGASEQQDNHISDLWVLPNFQRNGIGTLILKALEGDIMEKDFDEIRLETHSKNRSAIAMFQKNDYQICGLTSSYVQALDRSVDSVQMVKRL